MRIQEDYDILAMNPESLPDEIVLRVKLPDFDIGEIRAIQAKAQETGFITVEFLVASSHSPIVHFSSLLRRCSISFLCLDIGSRPAAPSIHQPRISLL